MLFSSVSNYSVHVLLVCKVTIPYIRIMRFVAPSALFPIIRSCISSHLTFKFYLLLHDSTICQFYNCRNSKVLSVLSTSPSSLHVLFSASTFDVIVFSVCCPINDYSPKATSCSPSRSIMWSSSAYVHLSSIVVKYRCLL